MKVYGPYTRKDGRKHVIICHKDGTKQTKSYPRYLLENHLGRNLTELETVDHIDNDFTNDSLPNLQILSREDNASKNAKLNPRKYYTFICPVCNKQATKPLNYVLHNKNLGKAGPYCSRSCAGKMHN